MSITFVHGMRQEGKNPDELRDSWTNALRQAWTAAGLPRRDLSPQMPFYGDVLNELTEAVRKKSNLSVTRGDVDSSTFSSFEHDLIRETGQAEGVTDAEVQAELGREVVTRGPLNWEWTQALCRVLERKVPPLGRFGLGYVRQVDSYLTRPHIRAAVDEIVRPSLAAGPSVLVAHSLGSIVAYRLLRELGNDVAIPLFVTLGCPLGIDVVKRFVRPPSLARPVGVSRWINGTDERDYVALVGRLDRDTFAEGIVNLSDIHNGDDDPHLINDYLADTTISKEIHAALS